MAMAAQDGRAQAALITEIFERGYRFELPQLIRLVLRLHSDRRPIGHSGPPATEALRLYGVHELSSPEAMVKAVNVRPPYRRLDEETPVPVHVQTPSGLTDAYSWCSLPAVYAEQVRKALDLDRNPALAEFIDLFNHRLLSLEYRAWEKGRFYIRYERAPEADVERQTLSFWALSLMGAGTPGTSNRLQIPDRFFLRYSGLFLPVARPAASLESLIEGVFGLPAQIQEFRGRWCEVKSADRVALTHPNNRLGAGGLLGDRTWYQQATFRIRIDTRSHDRFLSFLPGSRNFADIVAWIDHYTRREYEAVEIELTLETKDIPEFRLASAETLLPLGWLSWLNRARDATAGGVRTVVFQSTEPQALLRSWVQQALVDVRNRLLNEHRLRMTWAENVIRQLMNRCGRGRPQRSRVRAIVQELVERKLTAELAACDEAPGHVEIQVDGDSLAFAVG